MTRLGEDRARWSETMKLDEQQNTLDSGQMEKDDPDWIAFAQKL